MVLWLPFIKIQREVEQLLILLISSSTEQRKENCLQRRHVASYKHTLSLDKANAIYCLSWILCSDDFF